MNNFTMKYLAFVLGVTFIIPCAICDIAHENLLSATNDEASFVDPNLNHRGQNVRRSRNNPYGNRRLRQKVTPPEVTVPVFREVGQGFCIDYNKGYYSFFGLYELASEYDCLAWCYQQEQHSQLVGASFDYLLFHCLCHFTGGLPSDLNSASFSPAAQEKWTFNGTGIVSKADNTTDVVCFKKDKAQ